MIELTYPSATELGLTLDDEILESQQLQLVDPGPVIDHVQARFAFTDAPFDELIIFKASSKILRIASPPLEITARPAIDRVGIDFLRIDMANPRMTTSAVMTWGHGATKNVVDTDVEQCKAYLRRKPISLSPEQLALVSGRGFVIVRHDGLGLGVGFVESTCDDDDNFARMRNMYPRAYAKDLELTSPFGNPS